MKFHRQPSTLFAAAAFALLPAAAVTTAVFTPFDTAHAVDVFGAPSYIDYQGRVTDATGTPLAPPTVSGNTTVSTPKNYTITFRIYDLQTAGTLIWSEQQTATVDNGAFSVRLGEGIAGNGNGGTEVHPDLATVFNGKERYLGVTVTIPGQTAAEISPRLALLSVPYAVTANKAVSAVTAGAVQQAAGDTTTNTFNAATTFNSTVTASSFSGSGANLTNLNAANLTGTIADGRLSGNIPRLDASNTFRGTNSFGTLTGNPNFPEGLRVPALKNLELGAGTAKGTGSGLIFYNTGYSSVDINGGGNDGQRRINLVAENGTYLFGPLYGSNGLSVGTVDTPGSLTVTGNLTARGGLTVQTGSASYGEITTGSDGLHLGYNKTTEYPLQLMGSPYNELVLRSNDNPVNHDRYWKIGVGTSGYPLTMYPDASGLYFTSNLGMGQWLDSNTGNFTKFSDVRLKEDVTPLTDALDRLLQLRSVSYRYKTETHDAAKTLGLIAQDVEPLFPEVVAEGMGGYKGIGYSELIPVAIAAIQEQHQRIQDSDQRKQTEIDELRDQNKDLQAQLKAIRAQIDRLGKNTPAPQP